MFGRGPRVTYFETPCPVRKQGGFELGTLIAVKNLHWAIPTDPVLEDRVGGFFGCHRSQLIRFGVFCVVVDDG